MYVLKTGHLEQAVLIMSPCFGEKGICCRAGQTVPIAYYISTTLFVNHKQCLKSLAYFWYNALC
jgi:hypothetical protein